MKLKNDIYATINNQWSVFRKNGTSRKNKKNHKIYVESEFGVGSEFSFTLEKAMI